MSEDLEIRRTAAYLGCDHGAPETWPHDLIGRLIALRNQRGELAFLREIAALLTPPRRSHEPV